MGRRKSVKPTLHVWPQEPQFTEDSITISARLELDNQEQILWYQFPSVHRSALSSNSDPFLVATVLLAMTKASKLIIHGKVSTSLLRNVAEFQAAWSSWLPQCHEVPMEAEVEQELNIHPRAAAIAAFSGGVDSSYTAFRHGTRRLGRRTQPLQAGLFIHGFDIPLAQPETFQRALQKATKMLESLNLFTIPMATNFRQVMDAKIAWENSFGTAIASCLLMLQGKFNIGLIPSSYGYQNLSFPYGSNPITDPLLGHEKFCILYDGAEHRRLEKVEVLLNWPEALDSIRVCWQGAQKDRNCCRCEKCIRNILTFRLAGAGLPRCFEQDVTDAQIRQLRLQGGALDSLVSLQTMAQRQGMQASWLKAVDAAIQHSQRRIWLKRIYKTFIKV